MYRRLLNFFDYPVFKSWTAIALLYALLVIIASLQQIFGTHNYYDIFRYSFIHLRSGTTLYGFHPGEYIDLYLYGPLFALLFAPFSAVPFWMGWTAWIGFNAGILYYSIRKLPLTGPQQITILFLIAHELLTTIQRGTVNPFITACIILPFVFTARKKEGAATFFIALGMLIKIYPVVALACFPFSRQKIKFLLYFAGWIIVLGLLPLLFTTLPFLLQTYQQWFEQLLAKNELNINPDSLEDISVFGLLRRSAGWVTLPTLPVLAAASFAMACIYLRFKAWRLPAFQGMVLGAVLIFTTIFSTGAESSTYIIAMTGVAIWYVLQPRPVSPWHLFLIIFAFLLISMSPSDLVPSVARKFIVRHSLKALPATVIWICLLSQLYRGKFGSETVSTSSELISNP